MRLLFTILCALVGLGAHTVSAQTTRWVLVGANELGDSSFVDTVGIVRVDGFVNAWVNRKVSTERAMPGQTDVKYVSLMMRYRVECRTRLFAVLQNRYTTASGERYEDVPRPALKSTLQMQSPAPDSWEEFAVNYLCPKRNAPRP